MIFNSFTSWQTRTWEILKRFKANLICIIYVKKVEFSLVFQAELIAGG